jgi:integrase/recombinase XerD
MPILKGVNQMAKRGWIKTPDQIKEFALQNEDISNKGAYQNLMLQLGKTAKHSKGISITSQRQYYNHMDQFCRFLADQFNLKKLSNIKDKHVVAYVIERQSEGKSAAAIKQDLAAIRYFHDQQPETRNYLSENKKLTKCFPEFKLQKRSFGGVDRRPTEFEYQGLLNIAKASKRSEIAHIIQLAREQGGRVHEIVRLDRSDAEKALKENFLTFKGKGGLVRKVPLSEPAREILKKSISGVARGEKLFVANHEKAHTVIQRVQDFIRTHRNKVYDPLNTRPSGVSVTVHSMRHAYAKEKYEEIIRRGLSEKDARLETSYLIGHSREDITRIYLGE